MLKSSPQEPYREGFTELSMRILLGPGLNTPQGTEAFFVQALRRHADVVSFDHTFGHIDELWPKLPAGWEPDVVLVRDAEFYLMPADLQRVPCPIVGLIGDYNLSLSRLLPVMGVFDHFLCDSKGVRVFQKLGFENSEFFCLYGHDPQVHVPYQGPKDLDVVFVGSLDPNVQTIREKFVCRIARLHPRLRVMIAEQVFDRDYANLLGRAHLVFNRSIRDEANMRFFEGGACGSVVMNNPLEELDQLGFVPNRDYLAYDDPEEAIDRFFSLSPAQREEFRSNVQASLVGHSYDDRAQQLIARLESLALEPSRRRLLRLSQGDQKKRWEIYRKPSITTRTGERHPYDTELVRWQRGLLEDELEVNSLDTGRWMWFLDLLDASGLDHAIAGFAGARARFLEPFPVHHELREELAALAEIAAARIAA